MEQHIKWGLGVESGNCAHESMYVYLKYVGEIPEVEYVVELYCSWEERGGDFLVKVKCSVNKSLCITLNLRWESLGDVAS